MKKLSPNQIVVAIFISIVFFNFYLFVKSSVQNEKIIKFVNNHKGHPIGKLIEIRIALDKFYSVKGFYPQNNSFDGIKSCWGQSKSDWISDLVPDYITKLPDIDSQSAPCNKQILYRSINRGYKLIIHDPEDFDYVKKELPFLVDPERNAFAYGFWSELGIDL